VEDGACGTVCYNANEYTCDENGNTLIPLVQDEQAEVVAENMKSSSPVLVPSVLSGVFAVAFLIIIS